MIHPLCILRGIWSTIRCCSWRNNAWVSGHSYVISPDKTPDNIESLVCTLCGHTSIGWTWPERHTMNISQKSWVGLVNMRLSLWLSSPGGEDIKSVCICGSSRFVDLAAVVAWELEKRGILAYSMNLLPQWYGAEPDHQGEVEGVADVLDRLHFKKIGLADAVFVVNEGGYIGHRTSVEITYAATSGKPVFYLHDLPGQADSP